jgi:hypothetical protein
MSVDDVKPKPPGPSPAPVAKPEKPKVNAGRVLMVSVLAGLAAGTVSGLFKHAMRGSVLPAVLGSVLAGTITVIFEVNQEKKSK